MECLLWCFVALFVSVRLITRKTDFRLTRIYGGSSERSKSQSRKHQLQVRWGELKPAESRFFFLSFPFPLFLFLKTDERKARYRMFNEGKGWWAVLASQYANEMVSDALLYSGGYEWRPLLQNYYDNWGVFGGGAKLKVTLKHSPPPKCCFLQSVASHPDRNANFLSLREDEEIHNTYLGDNEAETWQRSVMITFRGAATLALRYEIEMVRYKLCWLPVKTTTESNSSKLLHVNLKSLYSSQTVKRRQLPLVVYVTEEWRAVKKLHMGDCCNTEESKLSRTEQKRTFYKK